MRRFCGMGDTSSLYLITLSAVSVLSKPQHQGQIDLLIEVAHRGLGDMDGGREFSVHFAVGGVVMLTPPANTNHHIVAVSGAGKGNALGLGRQQAQLGALTCRMTTVTRAAGDGEHPTESLDEFIPGQVVAKGQTVVTVGAGAEFRLIHEARLGV